MTTILLMLGALVVVFGVAALATRESSTMAPAQADRPDVVLPERASAADVRAVRFPLAVRGYRMRDVDEVLERLAAELDSRDARIAALEGRDDAVPAGLGEAPHEARHEAPETAVQQVPVVPAEPAVVLEKTEHDGSTAVPPLPSDVR